MERNEIIDLVNVLINELQNHDEPEFVDEVVSNIVNGSFMDY